MNTNRAEEICIILIGAFLLIYPSFPLSVNAVLFKFKEQRTMRDFAVIQKTLKLSMETMGS